MKRLRLTWTERVSDKELPMQRMCWILFDMIEKLNKLLCEFRIWYKHLSVELGIVP